MQVAKELFVIPSRDPATSSADYIIYLPLFGTGLRVTNGVIGQLQEASRDSAYIDRMEVSLRTKLRDLGVLLEKPELEERFVPKAPALREYKPTHVTLLPSYGCNLACLYCYSRGGEDITPPMTFDMARAAVDTIVRNALETEQKQIKLGFHGGGEPLIRGNIPLLMRSVDYFNEQASKYNLKGSVSTATNGVMRKETRDWAMKALSHFNISLDGPKDIQDLQRPLVGNKPSFEGVMETVDAFREAKISFGIRATVTEYSVERMVEMVDFFHSIFPGTRYHLEPLFECGRCATSNLHAPKPERFLLNYLKANDHARKLGTDTYYSGGKIDSVSQAFCGASGTNFFITPQGDVSTCLEVTRRDDPRAGVYIIGSFNEDNLDFDIDPSRRQTLCNRVVSGIGNCANCFAKYNCAGDCPAKILTETGDLMNTAGNSRCLINRAILLHQIELKLANLGA